MQLIQTSDERKLFTIGDDPLEGSVPVKEPEVEDDDLEDFDEEEDEDEEEDDEDEEDSDE